MPSRRPAPTILFTAIMASVVVVPWAVNGIPRPGPRTDAVAEDTVLVQQPLTGVGGGETVREINQDAPFSMVALTGTDLTGTSAQIRAKKPDGSWGTWYHLEGSADITDEAGKVSRGTDPVYVGSTTAVQIAVKRPHDAPVTVAPPDSGLDAGRDLGYVPANAEQSLSQNLSAILITPPKSPVERQWTPPTPPWARGNHPTSSAAPNGAPGAECAAAGPTTATASARGWSITPLPEMTTRQRIPRRSCAPFTPTIR
jgi:uncharacterized protein with LGFP repeats